MTTFKWMTLGALLGFSVAMGVSCGTAGKCSASNCAFGCCDASGTCQSGASDSQCGGQGNACMACVLGQSCRLGQCQAISSGTGGGSSSGGGTATGGGSSTGGGTGTGGGSSTGGGGGTADPLCARLAAADATFFAGNSVCSAGGFAIERNTMLLAQCNAGIGQCTGNDRTGLTSYAACTEAAPTCSTGNEAAALQAIQTCFVNVSSSVSSACQAALGGGSTGGGGGATGGGGGPSGGGGGVTGGGGGVTGGGTGTGGGVPAGGGGGVTCGPGNCSGCCNGTTCVASPTNSACGIGGGTCLNCAASGLICNTTSCVSPPVGGGTGGGAPVGGGGGTTCTTLPSMTALTSRSRGGYANTTSFEWTHADGLTASVDPSSYVNMEVIWAINGSATGVVVPGSRNLATEGTYASCNFCMTMGQTCTATAQTCTNNVCSVSQTSCTTTCGPSISCTGGLYLARAGTMNVSSAPRSSSGTFTGTATNVQFVEWDLQADTAVAGGRCYTVPQVSINASVVP